MKAIINKCTGILGWVFLILTILGVILLIVDETPLTNYGSIISFGLISIAFILLSKK